MQLIWTPLPKVMVILKEISFNCGSPVQLLIDEKNRPIVVFDRLLLKQKRKQILEDKCG